MFFLYAHRVRCKLSVACPSSFSFVVSFDVGEVATAPCRCDSPRIEPDTPLINPNMKRPEEADGNPIRSHRVSAKEFANLSQRLKSIIPVRALVEVRNDFEERITSYCI